MLVCYRGGLKVSLAIAQTVSLLTACLTRVNTALRSDLGSVVPLSCCCCSYEIFHSPGRESRERDNLSFGSIVSHSQPGSVILLYIRFSYHLYCLENFILFVDVSKCFVSLAASCLVLHFYGFLFNWWKHLFLWTPQIPSASCSKATIVYETLQWTLLSG